MAGQQCVLIGAERCDSKADAIFYEKPHSKTFSLVAGVKQSAPRPAWARRVSFKATGYFYAELGPNAALPDPAFIVEDGAELNPGGWLLPDDVMSISVIAPADCVVQTVWWR